MISIYCLEDAYTYDEVDQGLGLFLLTLMTSRPPLDRTEIAHVAYEPEAKPAEGSDGISSKSVKLSEDTQLRNLQPTGSSGKDEPIVTRKELWSYYRQSFLSFCELICSSV